MIFAHQGGWDEMLMVLTPVGLFVYLLWLANRRAEARLAEQTPKSADAPRAGASEPSKTDTAGTDPN